MYVLSCFPSFGHRRSGASVVAQRDPVGLWMVNHRLPSNFYNEVDGDCIKILGGVISICGKCGKTTRAEWRKRECNPIHYSSLRSLHQVPAVPRTKIHLCPNQFIQGTCHSDTALDWFQMEPFAWRHYIWWEKKKLQGVLYPWIGLLAYRIEIDKHSA